MQRYRFAAMILVGCVLVACSDAGSQPNQANPTHVPTLDINAIPVLGETHSAPPVPLPATDPQFPIQPDAAGQPLYEQYCAACHGIEGEGQLPDPYAYGAAPPHNADGHTWHHPDQQNFATVWHGNQGAGVMPAFFNRLTPNEIISILAYIKTWWEDDQLEEQIAQTDKIANP